MGRIGGRMSIAGGTLKAVEPPLLEKLVLCVVF